MMRSLAEHSNFSTSTKCIMSASGQNDIVDDIGAIGTFTGQNDIDKRHRCNASASGRFNISRDKMQYVRLPDKMTRGANLMRPLADALRLVLT
jgi:hypothetical protein